MTLREAGEVARKCMPVLYDHVMYLRIAAYGMKVSARGIEVPFVTLVSMSRNSTVDVRPEEVTAMGKEAGNA